MINLDKLNVIINMFQKDLLKENYKDLILDLEKEINSFLEKISFDKTRSIPTIILDNETVESLKQKLKKIDKNPENCLFEGVQKYEMIMREFLKCYHFGFLKEFYLTQNGDFYCEIPTLITKPSFSTSPIDEEINFNRQIEILEKEGISFTSFKNKKYTIEASTKNINTIKNIIAKIKGRHLSIDIKQRKEALLINSLKFYVSPKDLDSFTESFKKIEEPISEYLNNNELQQTYKLLKEIAQASKDVESAQVKDICGRLICSYFSEICDIFQIETSIHKEVKEEHKKQKEENIKKQELRKQIGEKITPDLIIKQVNLIFESFNAILEQELNCYINIFNIGTHSINITAKSIIGHWDDDYEMSDEEFNKVFITVDNAKRNDYSLFILDCDKNKKTIENKIKKLSKNAKISGYETNIKRIDYDTTDYLCINSFNIIIN